MSRDADWISTGLGRWVALILRFKKTTIVVGLIWGGFSVQYTVTHLGIDTDTADMISPQLDWRQDFIEYRESFAIRDRNIIIVIDASSAQQADSFAADLAGELREEPETFVSVFQAGDAEFFERNGLLYLSVAELEELADRLVDAQPLLGLMQTRFNGAGIIGVVTTAVDERLDSQRAAPAELGVLYTELAAVLDDAASGRRHPMAWRKLIAASADDSLRRILLVQPQLDFNRVQPARPGIERIRALVQQVDDRQPGMTTVRLTGTLAMEHEEMLGVSRGASLAGLAALAMVAVVLFWALRSMGLLIISLLTLLLGLSSTAAFAAVAIGHLNLLSVAFAVLYVGLGVDFILHICLRFKELLSAGSGVEPAVVATVRGVGASLVVCAVTTAAGFYSFIPTPFDGVSELGLISGTGMFISLIVSVSFLPAMLSVFMSDRVSAAPAAKGGHSFANMIISRPKCVLAVVLLVMVPTFAVLPDVSFDNNPIHLRDPNSESVLAIEDLAADSEAPLLNLLALANDHAAAIQWAEQLTALSVVREVVTLDSLVPADQIQKQFLLEDIELVMGPGLAGIERLDPDTAALNEQLRALGQSLRRVGNLGAAEQALQGSVASLLTAIDRAVVADRVGMLTRLDQDLSSDLPEQLERLALGLQAQPFSRDDLPGDLTERWISTAGKELIEIVPAENISDNDAAERFIAAVREVIPTTTGLPVVYQEASATVVRSFQLALSYAFIMVSVLLLIFLRRLGDSLLVLVPILFAAGVTAGMTVWLGIPFNFANIIALPLLIGVGVDNGIHIVHRMRTEPPKDGEPFSTSTSRAVLASGVTTIASFGNLAFSAHVGMSSMGKLLTLGMVVTLFATLLLLPALIKIRAGT